MGIVNDIWKDSAILTSAQILSHFSCIWRLALRWTFSTLLNAFLFVIHTTFWATFFLFLLSLFFIPSGSCSTKCQTTIVTFKLNHNRSIRLYPHNRQRTIFFFYCETVNRKRKKKLEIIWFLYRILNKVQIENTIRLKSIFSKWHRVFFKHHDEWTRMIVSTFPNSDVRALLFIYFKHSSKHSIFT